jgi:hypothetical protein
LSRADAALDERLLEGKRAAEHEADEIVAPEGRDVVHFFLNHTVAPDAVPGQIGPEVDVGTERRQQRTAARRHPDQWTRLGIALAEEPEVVSIGRRQHDEIPLHESRRQTRRDARQPSLPRCRAHIARSRRRGGGRHAVDCLPRVSGSESAAMKSSEYAIVAKVAMARDRGIVADATKPSGKPSSQSTLLETGSCVYASTISTAHTENNRKRFRRPIRSASHAPTR